MRPSTGRFAARGNPAAPSDLRAATGLLFSRIGVVGVLFLLTTASGSLAQGGAEADQVVAAFVSRFPHFVEWPLAAIADRPSVEICVWEPNPFGSILDRLVEDEELNGRSLAVHTVGRAEMTDGCHVLFLPAGTEHVGALLAQLDSRPVLTIGASSDFLELGGIIKLLVIGRRVRFEVNAAAADRAGLRLSSQLLGLALDVRGRS